MTDPSILAWGLGVLASLTVAGIVACVASIVAMRERIARLEEQARALADGAEATIARLDRFDEKIERMRER